MAEHAVELEVASRVLAARRVSGPDITRGFYVVRHRRLPLTPLHRRFLAMLRAGSPSSQALGGRMVGHPPKAPGVPAGSEPEAFSEKPLPTKGARAPLGEG